MATIPMPESTQRLWNYYTIGGLLLFTFIRERYLMKPVEIQFINVCKAVIITTILIIILHYHQVINGVYAVMFWFDYYIFVVMVGAMGSQSKRIYLY